IGQFRYTAELGHDCRPGSSAESTNMEPQSSQRIDVLLAEYKTLKSEQQARIALRDNLLYVTLGASGAIVAFALSKDAPPAALLAIPWLTLIVGWTYVVNDEKNSAAGQYIRERLEPAVRSVAGSPDSLFAWELAHRGDSYRRERKLIQLLVDLLA